VVRSRSHRAHAAHQRQPGRHGPLAVSAQRTEPAAQLKPVGSRRGDRTRAGQVLDERFEFGRAGAPPRPVRNAPRTRSMSIRPSATALCSRRSVPLRSASEIGERALRRGSARRKS
jgi:hypothetical protein